MAKKKMKNKSEGTEKKQIQDVIRAGVGGVIERNGTWLLVKRADSSSKEPGKWAFFGGAVGYGEMGKDALVSLVESGFGMTVEVGPFIGIYEGIIDGTHWVSPQYRLTIKSGMPQIIDSDVASGIGWFSADEMTHLPLSEMTKTVLEMMK